MNRSLTVGILGCGWLGLGLAKRLLKTGYIVKGTTTTKDKQKLLNNIGIASYEVQLYPDGNFDSLSSFLEGLKILIIAIPPRIKDGKSLMYQALKKIFSQYNFSELEKLVYVSSTGVFADGINVEYNEISKPNSATPRGTTLIELEKLIQEQSKVVKTTIVRFGGLVAHKDRHPIYYLSKKSLVHNPKAPVNLIDRVDAVTILTEIIKRDNPIQIIHGVYPYHPSKETYYTQKAKEYDLKTPNFNFSGSSVGKKITSIYPNETFYFEYVQKV